MGCNLEFIIYVFTVTVNDSVINKPCLTESKNLVARIVVKLQKQRLRRSENTKKVISFFSVLSSFSSSSSSILTTTDTTTTRDDVVTVVGSSAGLTGANSDIVEIAVTSSSAIEPT